MATPAPGTPWRLLPLALLALLAARQSPAAESYDGCAGFIDSLPATISTQGVWCLRHDLSTAMASGNAIEIATNNVTIDCNDFKIGGLAAGEASQAEGIYARNRQNVTVRNCSIRGFASGLHVFGGAGHLVEDNRLDNNLVAGIKLYGVEASVVRRNRVADTASTIVSSRFGIMLNVPAGAAYEISGNSVSGVVGPEGQANVVYGIYAYGGSGGLVRGNRVDGLLAGNASAPVRGIDVSGGTFVRDNQVAMGADTPISTGIKCNGPGASLRGNVAFGFDRAYADCSNDGWNASL